jgi:hypothetical protein
MAMYAPHFTYATAVNTLARYSAADGALGVRKGRFARMALRCVAMLLVAGLVRWTLWPLAVIAILEFYFAIERDRSVLTAGGIGALLPRLVFSLSVPWVTTFQYMRGALTKSNQPNPQNAL